MKSTSLDSFAGQWMSKTARTGLTNSSNKPKYIIADEDRSLVVLVVRQCLMRICVKLLNNILILEKVYFLWDTSY